MRILFVIDGRSPIALNWVSYFVAAGHEIHMVSTYPCAPDLGVASLEIIPVAFAGAAGAGARSRAGGVRALLPVGLRTAVRQWLGPFSLSGAARRFASVVERIQPDLVHAMRIPYEGMLAALAMRDGVDPPLLISVWGNDFTLHAPSNPILGHNTRIALRRADGLHADCQRDIRLAEEWGFDTRKPAILLPGGGGVRLDIFLPPEDGKGDAQQPPTVINPRGFRAYINNEAFFKSIPFVLKEQPQTRFLCPAMAGESQALGWVEQYGIANNVTLLPHQPRSAMAELFRQSWVAVSPSRHDGTPNTLLEAMACGCFPVAGDLVSVREWITPGENGLLVNPNASQELARAILTALDDPVLRHKARQQNLQLVSERADYKQVMPAAESFYQQITPAI